MNKLTEILIFSENIDALRELSVAARETGEIVTAIVVGNEEDGKTAIANGADKVYLLEERYSHILEDFVPSIQKLVSEHKPSAMLIKASRRGRLVAGRLAASLKTSVLTDTSRLWVDSGSLYSSRMVYGGAAMRTERSKGNVPVVLIGDGLYDPLPADTSRKGEIAGALYIPPANQTRIVENKPKGGEMVNLAVAKKIISIGRGIGNQGDIAMIEELAKVLGAEIGCSRPITEGEHWLPTERYIGVSGVMVKPDVIFVIGVSGQIQFTVGINTAKTIIVINNDKNAPIFKEADYGIVGNLYNVIPVLTEKLKSE